MYAYAALAALQLIGGFQQGSIIRANGDLQANIANMNARFSELDAYNALTSGYSNAAKYANTINSTVASDRAAYAGEGVSVGYGTAAAVQSDNRIAGLVNTLQMQRSARDQAMGYEGQAINIRVGGAMTSLQFRLNASAAEFQGVAGAASTGISGYDRSLSTGKGNTSRTGTNDQSWKNTMTDIHVSPDGGSMYSPYSFGGPSHSNSFSAETEA